MKKYLHVDENENIVENKTVQNWKRGRKNRVSSRRLNQLKLLLMIGFVRKFKKAYLFDLDYQQIHFITNNENLLSTTYKGMSELEKMIQSKLQATVKGRNRNGKINKQNTVYLKQKQLSETISFFGLREKDKWREEVVHFERMNLVIDRKNKKCSIKESQQHLVILVSIVVKIKTLIYRHYKIIKQKNDENQIRSIKYYCSQLFVHFKKLICLIQNNIDKNANYKKYLCTLKKHQPIVKEDNNNFQQYLQALLFYFSSIIELKRFYQISSNNQQIGNNISEQVLSKITSNIVRIRHFLGYLGKIISDPLIAKQKCLKSQNLKNDLWRHIYERKYIAKGHNRLLQLG